MNVSHDTVRNKLSLLHERSLNTRFTLAVWQMLQTALLLLVVLSPLTTTCLGLLLAFLSPVSVQLQTTPTGTLGQQGPARAKAPLPLQWGGCWVAPSADGSQTVSGLL